MGKPDKLPRDVKQECLWIVRGYDRRRKAYLQQQRDILDAGGEKYITYKSPESGEECRAYMPHGFAQSRDVEARQAKLEALEQTLETRKMRAVEYAMGKAGADLPKDMRERLRNAIILNCTDRHEWPFERLNLTGLSLRGFYRRKDLFLLDVAKFLGMS